MADILIQGGLIGTQDAGRRVFADGAVAIAGNRIAAVGPTAEVAAACTGGGRGGVTPPHMYQAK